MTTGVFNYIEDLSVANSSTKPWNKVDVYKTSFKTVEHQRPVTDLRKVADPNAFGIDKSGFAFFECPSSEKEFATDDAIRNKYYADVEVLLRDKLLGIKKIVIFDYTIRRRDKESPRQPVQLVHVDQTPAAAEARVRRHIADPFEAEELLEGRFQLINIWRPIAYDAQDSPLAVVDWRSTKPEDFVPVDLLYPNREGRDGDSSGGREVLADTSTIDSTEGYTARGEQYVVAPNSGHNFFFVKDMTPDEVLLIKCFDSKSHGRPNGIHGVAGLTPHSAFTDPNTPPTAKARQSIEVRCLVFYN